MTGIGRYLLQAPLGSGGSSGVWRAVGPQGEVVAIKRVPCGAGDASTALRGEAQALAAVDHPNVLRLIEVVEDGGGTAMVTEHAGGGSLADRLSVGPLDAAEVMRIGCAIAAALEATHRRGLVHRDVKPANILFSADGRPLLADFGLARPIGRQGAVAGTAGYLAPEVVDGMPPDERADTFALAAVCYEALTGVPAFPGEAPVGAGERAGVPPLRAPAPQVPPVMAAAIERSLQPEPARRHPHAASFAAGLRGTATAEVNRRTTREFGPRPRPQPPRDPATSPRRLDLRVAAAALMLLALPSLVVWLLPRQAAGDEPADPVASPLCPALPHSQQPVFIDGSRCPAGMSFSGGVVTLTAAGNRRRLAVGRPGDVPLVGDFNCDGGETLALYRPESGQVFVFPGWPEPGAEVTSGPAVSSHPPHGHPRLVRGQHGCAAVTVGETASPTLAAGRH